MHALIGKPDRRGMIALVTVIVIGATLLTIGISAAMIGQTDLVISGHADRERSTRLLASACAEEALHRLKLNAAYSGGTIGIGTDSCTASVAGSGSTRTVTVSATVEGYTKSVIVGALLKQNVAGNARAWAIDSWSEGNPP